MATQTDIPPYLTAYDIAFILHDLNAQFNSTILHSLVTVMNKSRPIGHATIIVLVLLYISTSMNYAFQWSLISSVFIDNSQNIWTKYVRLEGGDITATLGLSITALVCTILADSTIIWRCWMVWGQRYLIVLLPSLCLCCAIAFKSISLYHQLASTNDNDSLIMVLYAAFILITTLWCTLLIIFRILTVGRASRASDSAGSALQAYRHIIEVLVESSALYSVALILYMVFFARNDWAAYCLDSLGAIIRGIAPTVLIGRVAAGHARPDDTWQASVMSSLRFGQDRAMRHSQEDFMTSTITDSDLEAQVERGSEEEPTSKQMGFQEAQPENGDEDRNAIHVAARQ
ncbi:hypothetical protein ARMGADRAFT_1024142 [Armillaria gallica]|uniref:Uncharacterized protein n=1 Tax=Armillaria gallica TaxID=47427 RepID=A0A2H3EG12_ARMGA|nr:hypothetical protein ARMGADRAFT_1024142 [Armillaria gallica]